MQVDLSDIISTLQSASLLGLAACGFVLFPLAFFDALRWQSVLRALSYRISLSSALTYNFCGFFFGNLAPAFLGVDAFRAAQMYRQGIPVDASIRAVITDRLAAFITLMIVVGFGLPFFYQIVGRWADIAIFIIIWAIGSSALASIVFVSFVRKLLPAFFRGSIGGQMTKLSVALRTILTNASNTGHIILYGCLVHILRCIIVYSLSHALGFDLSFWIVFAIVPISLLIAMIPISLADWGIREAVFIYTLGLGGLAPEKAFTLSVVYGLFRIWSGIVGSVVWLSTKKHHYALRDTSVPDADTLDTAMSDVTANNRPPANLS